MPLNGVLTYRRARALKYVDCGLLQARGRGMDLNPIIMMINWVEWLWENRMLYRFGFYIHAVIHSYFVVVDL